MTEAIYFRVSDYVRRITYHLFKWLSLNFVFLAANMFSK
jgi:hypothetical protein